VTLGGSLAPGALVERLRAAIGTGDRRLAARLIRTHDAVIDAAEGTDGARARGLRNMLTPSVSTGADLRRLAKEQAGLATSAAQRAETAVMAGLLTYPVDADESMAWFHVAREEAVASGALASELDATRNLVSVQMALGRHEEARELARAAERKAAESGERSWSIEFRTLEMLSRFYDHGDHDEALSWLSYVRTAPVRLETRALATAALATLLADRGAVRRSAEVLEPWMDRDRLERLEPFSQAFLAWGAAQRSWIIGDLADAIRIGRWVTETVPPGYPSLAGTQVVWRWAEYESGVALSAPDPAGGLLDSATIEAGAIDMLADGRPADAAEAFLAAADSWRPILWRCTLRCRWAAGHALSLAGDRRAARSLLESVDAELDRSGVPALRPRVLASLRSTDRAPTAPSQGPRVSSLLTSQEHKVLLLVVEGLTSNEIARRLGIAPSTVNTHVRSAKHKLGARTRIEAAAMVGLQVD
jgi:DNA-binding CsgD family transcriptional regulator